MIVVGALFFVLAVFHIREDLLGSQASLILHFVPFAVLSYAIYEYRKLLRESSAMPS